MTHYAGWAILGPVREQLLGMCPPIHPEVRCEHVTFQLVPSYAALPPPAEIVIRGMYYDEQCQALAVQVNGIVVRPADGLLFHVTISHVQGFPSALVGPRMQERPQLLREIAPWPILGTMPFVREIG